MLNYGDISNMLHEKFNDLGFAATSEHSDQPQHPPSLTMQSLLCALMIVRLSLLRKTILIPEYLAFMCFCVFVDGCISQF